jgi:hypothetical protein
MFIDFVSMMGFSLVAFSCKTRQMVYRYGWN